ncbi:head-tail joining protein, partial [Escherichia coli]|uniref:head-tail joining protein n=1 Tax=Escherichia coli TaxID=562 RepID=UPI0020765FC4
MADFDNLFDAAIARADETIRGYMGTSATMTSGERSGAVIRGVFDDPENISYAGQGVRVEGSSPSLFVLFFIHLSQPTRPMLIPYAVVGVQNNKQ